MDSTVTPHATIRTDHGSEADVYDALNLPGSIVLVISDSVDTAAIVLDPEQRNALIAALQTCPTDGRL